MFIAVLFFGLLVSWILLTAFRSRIIFWGSTPEERQMPLPGTDRLKNVRIMDTHAVSIFAAPERIWPYLLQIGQNRGGFYSYRSLENLVGCRMPDVDRIRPELQKLSVGDPIYLHPKAPPLKVTVLEPNRVLAMDGWYLVLKPITSTETRLVTRSYDWRDPNRKSKVADFFLSGVMFDSVHFIMERKMLLTIKRLAEASQER